jgi:hypothetical protein
MSQLSDNEQGDLYGVMHPNVTENDLRRAVKFGGLGDYGDLKGDTYPDRLESAIDCYSKKYRILAFTIAVYKEAQTPPLKQWIDSHREALRASEVNPVPEDGTNGQASVPAGDERDLYMAVARFDEQCKQRKEQFGYLRANKRLHDILHRVPPCEFLLRMMAESVKRGGPKPPALAFRELDTLVAEAKAELEHIESAADQEDWVQVLCDSAKAIRGWFTGAPGTPDTALEALAMLPSQNQKGLNRELAGIAKRLKADDLRASADAVLQALRDLKRPSPIDAGQVEQFQQTCLVLVGLVIDHDGCQSTATTLIPAEGRKDVTPEQFGKWPKLKASLAALAERRAQDELARDTARLVIEFETAAAAARQATAARAAGATAGATARTEAEIAADAARQAAFETFFGKFQDLFFAVDGQLLDASTSLDTQVTQLSASLGGYLRGLRGK